ncbi:alpha-hydroxy acid oxidase [Zestomonas thermotolerans]|jgi:4-hydroxymandelate oxidase|uniref:alpha-hydroxy acid oxidase n=1 Tax=Zestomonas thermotolerans TaxID=157784 RepID=UPI0023F3EAC1|nr:alpha-hydroxy acid oxidase [Pseudomonas thermotolerans]MBO2511497.1 alpha-hydroxy-acid oxidizing enzyme [Gammaproteobacteria bacterium]
MNQLLPKLQRIPPEIAAVADYEPFARERMSAQAWAYIAGGAADELTLRDNCAAFQRLRLRSRVLRDLRGGHTRLELFGRTFDHPILLAPVAYQKLAHPDGELASALAAGTLGGGMVVSTQASIGLEEIAAQARGPLWFQLYVQHDREFTAELVRRAEAAGYQALVLTVDAPVNGVRNREQRAGFALPEDVEAVNLRGLRPLEGPADGRILLGTPLLETAPTWEDLAWLRSLTRLPLLVKGVLDAEDARQALAAGVDGIIVSNHGGRTLDGLPATIEVLEAVAQAVQGRVPLLMDGGIRRGSDVFKALALGADAVLVGRPYVFGLATAGALGVAHVLQLLRAELEVSMALTGCRTLADIQPELILR